MGTAATILVLFVVGLVGTSWFAVKARHAAKRELEQRDVAEAQTKEVARLASVAQLAEKAARNEMTNSRRIASVRRKRHQTRLRREPSDRCRG